MNPEQITERHRSRLALVYVRQSSLHQVIHHQESSLDPAQAGQTEKRYYSFEATERLALATASRPNATGREMITVFVWERLP